MIIHPMVSLGFLGGSYVMATLARYYIRKLDRFSFLSLMVISFIVEVFTLVFISAMRMN